MIERGKPLESGSQRVEKWDPDRNTLIVEIIEPLKPGLHDVTIQMSQGRIVVEGSDDPAPRLVTRLYVFASSQDEARNFLQAKNCGFKIRKGPGSISVDARSQEGVIVQGGNIVIGRGG